MMRIRILGSGLRIKQLLLGLSLLLNVAQTPAIVGVEQRINGTANRSADPGALNIEVQACVAYRQRNYPSVVREEKGIKASDITYVGLGTFPKGEEWGFGIALAPDVMIYAQYHSDERDKAQAIVRNLQDWIQLCKTTPH